MTAWRRSSWVAVSVARPAQPGAASTPATTSRCGCCCRARASSASVPPAPRRCTGWVEFGPGGVVVSRHQAARAEAFGRAAGAPSVPGLRGAADELLEEFAVVAVGVVGHPQCRVAVLERRSGRLCCFALPALLREPQRCGNVRAGCGRRVQPRNRSWTRPSGPPWRALARPGAGVPCASLGLDAVGLCPRGEATRPACVRAAQSGV